MIKIFLFLCSLLSLFSFLCKAQDTINVPLPLDGKFYIYQDSYKNGSTTTESDANVYKFTKGTLNERVYIDTDVTGKRVLFDSISTIYSISYATYGKGTDGTFVFSDNCIWKYDFYIYQGEYLFTGDSLKFSETTEAIKVGRSSTNADCHVTLDLEYINLNSAAIEIGSSTYARKLTINKGIISDGAIVANTVETGNIIIDAASVNSELEGNVTDADGNAVYQVKLPHNGNQSFTVQKDGVNFRDYSFICFHNDDEGNDDPCYYIYLPDGSYSATTGTETYTFTVDGEPVDAAEKQPIAGNGTIDLSSGEFSLINDGYQVGDQPYTYDGSNGYTFTGTTTGTVTIPADFPADTIMFHNLTIDCSEAVTNDAPITIGKTDTFAIVLSGNSYLKVKSGSSGSVYNSGGCMLNISGTAADNSDTLFLARYATIKGGKLTVKNGTYNTLSLFSGDSLFVEGGVISTYYLNTSGATVINGGTFSRYDEYEHTAGGELSNITINGGMVYLEFKNQKDPGIGETVKINGGSVLIENTSDNLAAAGDGTRPFAKDSCPTRTNGTEVIYQSIYKFPVPAGTKIEGITVNGVAYPCNDVYTDTANSVYLWLPETEDTGDDPVTNVTITAGGIEFKFRGYVDCQNEYVAYTDAINPGQGNKQSMIPLFQATTENGSYLLNCNYITTYNDTLYACSGSKVSVCTTADENYIVDNIAVNDEALDDGDTTFTVVRPDQPVNQMWVSVAFKLNMLPLIKENTENGSFELNGSSTATYNDILYATIGSEVSITLTPDEGYELDSITVNGTRLADEETTFTIDESASQMVVTVTFKATGTSVIDAPNTNAVKVYGIQNAVCIQGAKRANVHIISLSGIKVYSAQNVSSATIPAQPGLYIVVVNNEAYKIMVK